MNIYHKEKVIRDAKRSLRKVAAKSRDQLQNKESKSREILSHLRGLSAYVEAGTVLIYLDFRSEVRTRGFIQEIVGDEKRAVVPMCEGSDLRLVQIEGLEELEEGKFGILEPRDEVARDPSAQVGEQEIDLALLPGLAFDSNLKRLGYGKGYYDKLLAQVPSETTVIGLAYDCQIYPDVPSENHDVPMDMVITEKRVFPAT